MKLGYVKQYKSKLLIDEHQNYTKFDFILSIGYFMYLIIITSFFGWLLASSDAIQEFFMRSQLNKILVVLLVSIIELVPLMVILKWRKQSYRSIGFHQEKFILSVVVGVIFVIPELIIFKVDLFLFKSLNIQTLIIKFFYYFFCIALVEELIFRGYLQSRIQGWITSKWLSVIVVGLFFSAMHIPIRFIDSGQEFLPFIQAELSHLLYTFISHFYFLFVYRLTNNIFAPTMTHAILNVINNSI